ncbi:AT-rich interactive domain-containing protein 2 [Culex quinquefasciatus]|uniref:AT-rich interactive domain-containing protein 2 n=1 Tax=Culex quinquefasciatus TaxID=7176 RepID=UPI0018E3C78E|nr:AT-rich interactive domain-containing protein 2 [Culex quinquefasciatus]
MVGGAGAGRGRGESWFSKKDKASFLQDLQLFHDRNWTQFMRLPKIGGRDVDLHRLYLVVVARWTKLKFKQIYIRFSNKYDKVNFNGEEKDPTEKGNDEKRHNRRWSARMLHSVPAVYDNQQHYVPEVMTGQCGMS